MDATTHFDELFRAHADAVRRYAVRRGSRDPDDVVSEAFAVLWRQVPPPDDPVAFLFAVAWRVVSRQRRGDLRPGNLAERVATLDRPAVVEAPIAGLDPGLATALASLSEADRELLLLHVWDELERGQIAKCLGVSPRVVSVRLHRAKARFRTHYKAARFAADASSEAPEGEHAI